MARGANGKTAVYPVAHNVHVNGILDCTTVPVSRIEGDDPGRPHRAGLDYVGVLAVEMFVVDGRLLVNELAPRPHNSGHWTLDAARTSQFEQQVRAVCGVGLGDPSLTAPAVAMVNLLGDLWADGEPDWSAALADPARIAAPVRRSRHPGRDERWATSRSPRRRRTKPGGGQWPSDPGPDRSIVCADHGCRNHHRHDRLARSDLQPQLVPAGDPGDRLPRLDHPDRAERDVRDHRWRRRQPRHAEHLRGHHRRRARGVPRRQHGVPHRLPGQRLVPAPCRTKAEVRPQAGMGADPDPASAAVCC